MEGVTPHDSMSHSDAPDRSLATSLSDQIVAMLRQRIASGEWPEHYRLRPEPELAAALEVSRGTLRKAMALLVEEGQLVKIPGRGTFVASRSIDSTIANQLTTIMEDLTGQGIPVTTQVRDQRVIPAPAPLAALLDAAPGSPVLRLERLRSDPKGPVALLINYVRCDLAPGIEDVDFSQQTLFGYLEGACRLKIGHGRRTFGAARAPEGIDRVLHVELGSPLLLLEQITYLASRSPVETSEVWINSERLRPAAMLPRHPSPGSAVWDSASQGLR